MNNFNFPLYNLTNEDEELSKKIKEYNKIFNTNNSINLNFNNFNNNNNSNNNLNNNNFSNNEIIPNLINKNTSNHITQNNQPNSGLLNISKIENEYDTYILNLKVQLSKEKAERKKKEEEAILIQHR